MLAILFRRCLCNRIYQSNVRLPSSKSISDITLKPQALFYYCTYWNFTVFCSKYNFKSSKCSQYNYGRACAIDNPIQMWGCQVLKALVILLWNHWSRWHPTFLSGSSVQPSTSVSLQTPQPRSEWPSASLATWGWTRGRLGFIADTLRWERGASSGRTQQRDRAVEPRT